MAAPSLSLQHARRQPGRRSKAASGGNRGRVGIPISGRYGDLVCADRAGQVSQMRRRCQWLGRDSAASGRCGVDFGRWLAGRSRGREVKRTSGIVAGINQRHRGQWDHRGDGAWRHEVLILMMSARAEGRWRGPRAASKVSMITMRLPQCGQGWTWVSGPVVSSHGPS